MAPLISAKQRAINASIYDPQVKFLEIGVNVNGVWAYKVYGPDLNGVNGGLQGTGGLEATIMNGTGTATGVINDAFGNGVATISGGSVTWNTTHVAGYGPLPDSTATPLTGRESPEFQCSEEIVRHEIGMVLNDFLDRHARG